MTQRLNGWRLPAITARGLGDCSLVVPTWRRPETMVVLLNRLLELPDPPTEVVVVDGSPDTLTSDALRAAAGQRELPFELRYLRSPAGLTRQRNVGIDASTKEFVFYLDDDCWPEPEYFRAIHEVFASDETRSVGAVCGSILNEMNRPMPLRWRLRLRLGLVPRGEPGRYYPTATSVPRCTVTPFQGTRRVDIVPGGATAYRREVFRRHRFSSFFEGYSQGEDLEMSLRIGCDWQLLWCGEAHCVHQHVSVGRPASYQKGYMEIRNRYLIWRRHTHQPSLGCRVRLWLDFAYIFICDIASWVRHPRQGGYIQHAAGIVMGGLACLLKPPQHQEPPARREYEVEFATATGKVNEACKQPSTM
jgi:glycosyltransferase involved in cell wall biosynthesis